MAVKGKTLTEWHVSMAPMISYDFWKKCCGAFAAQLIDQGYILQAASYLSCLHQTKEVIAILLKNTLFLEAWCYAKLHLEDGDHLFKDIIEKWTRTLEMNGNIEGAAYISALNNNFEKCRDLLRKRRRDEEGDKLLQLVEEKLN
uniref:Gem-associated protein 5 TPR domain-containing protein n=1 Tax=Megaselia scalaris TaxID=36166 RepID=T1GCI9_MEGSC